MDEESDVASENNQDSEEVVDDNFEEASPDESQEPEAAPQEAADETAADGGEPEETPSSDAPMAALARSRRLQWGNARVATPVPSYLHGNICTVAAQGNAKENFNYATNTYSYKMFESIFLGKGD